MIKDAPTPIGHYADVKDGFCRTALIVDDPNAGSVDVVVFIGGKMVRVCQINISIGEVGTSEEYLIVDTIDVDRRYDKRRALVFPEEGAGSMEMPANALVSADFRKGS